jgi:hypothetical protein
MSDQNQQQPVQQPPRAMTIAETITMLSSKFDEVKNQTLQVIASLEAQIISLSNKEKDK